MRKFHVTCTVLAGLLLLSWLSQCRAVDGWIDLTKDGLAAWKSPHGDWTTASAVRLEANDPRRFTWDTGVGILVNGRAGKTNNLVTCQDFGDVELHLEFAVPKGSNSGVKFAGVYEIQLFDSWGKKEVTASDCGGIYPRAELEPRYHHIDKGIPPLCNACQPPGQWQTLYVAFQMPRFNSRGEKIAHARFIRVALNGTVIHHDVRLRWPTGHAWRLAEKERGPLLLQADHGPVAFRNVRIRPLTNHGHLRTRVP